jgi:hypothetical protein
MQFNLKIGNDVINFISIETESETGIPQNDLDLVMLKTLSSSPSVIEITNFLYNPQEDSVWDGKDFIDSENREVRPLAKINDGFKKFAFVVDNKYKFFRGIPNTPENEMLIAALSSNPEIIVE